ncbi:MAG: polyribonucleotide nucleotidyltransferase [Clostridiales bacterium]|jgi:polyribonucleotide nucleotidyltransferase|nr:polyribonucleotide nucleotidyltransferase [Clostridiales bacterium]
MYRTYKLDLGGRTLSVEIGRIAEQASGSALVRYGDTVVLVAATSSAKPRAGIDFFPLSVDYEEKLYSVGRIPGGFIKREGRPTEKAVLTSRLIDRPIRPLFPKDYRNDVAVVATVMSVDQDCDPGIAAMIGASVALSISPIPFNGPTGATSVGLVGDELMINPTAAQRDASRLNLTVTSTGEKVMMIEAGASEISNDIMFRAIEMAHAKNAEIVGFINGIVAAEGVRKAPYEEHTVPADVMERIYAVIPAAEMEEAVLADAKQDRDVKIAALTDRAAETIAAEYGDGAPEGLAALIGEGVYNYEKKTVRRMILRDHKRPDGRALDAIRSLSAEVGLLPRTHGSALFARGQTQVMTATTLGSISDAQRLDGLDELEVGKRYMHHYNFPSYSVGETRPSRGPGRREIGHGALAERALLPVIPSEDEFPYAIRLVSEVLSSNGSTSQGSVCASTLSLMDAGVPIKRPVAGISCGLVVGDSDDDFILMTDIQGLEDFFGDMDFKVAGTSEGITAIQMDIKINGLTPEIIRAALDDTLRARTYILNEVMLKCIDKPRAELSKYAPKIAVVQINPEKLSEVIGSRGKVINRIITESGVLKIDTEDDGRIFICGDTPEQIQKASDMINLIARDPEVGRIYNGVVTKIIPIGAFVEIAPEKEGLVKISKISPRHIEKIEDVLSEGDKVMVKLLEIDSQGRLNLSIRDALPPDILAEYAAEDREHKRPRRPPGAGRPPTRGDERGERGKRPPRR